MFFFQLIWYVVQNILTLPLLCALKHILNLDIFFLFQKMQNVFFCCRSIVNPVYYIETDKERNYFSEVDIKLELNNGMPNFFLSISKESKDVTGGMNENLDNVKHFSDVYEVRAWGNVPDTIKFTLKIKGSLRCNEQLYIEPIDGEVKGKEITEKSQNTAEVKEEVHYMQYESNLSVSPCKNQAGGETWYKKNIILISVLR